MTNAEIRMTNEGPTANERRRRPSIVIGHSTISRHSIFDIRHSRLFLLRLSIFLAAAAGIGGCGRPAGVIFPPANPPVVWPAPPEQERIRYVGQLSTSSDLKPAVSFGEALAHAVVGKPDVRSMLSPYGVCTDGADCLFVADSNAQVVHVFDLKTRKYAQWFPNNPEKRFSQPVGVAYDPLSKRLAVADPPAGSVYLFDDRGRSLGEVGRGALLRPCGIAFDRNGRLLVVDSAAHQVAVIDTNGEIRQRVGKRGTQLGEFNYPTNVAIDSQGRVYVSDSLNFRVQQFSPELSPIRQIGEKGDMPGYFSQPKGVALDSEDHLYVVDANFEAVEIFTSDGQLLMDFGTEGTGIGEFWLPAGIFIDARNRIWVADVYNRRVQVFDYVPEKK